MTRVVVFSPKAITDIAELLDYLLPRAGQRTTRRFIDDLVDYCEGFALFPERGTNREDIASGLRVDGYRRRASIAFLVEDQTVTILRIFYGGRAVRVEPA